MFALALYSALFNSLPLATGLTSEFPATQVSGDGCSSQLALSVHFRSKNARSLCTNAAGATSLFVHLTGHIAGPQQVVLPIKCGERLGRGVDPRTQEQATLETLDRQGGRSQ